MKYHSNIKFWVVIVSSCFALAVCDFAIAEKMVEDKSAMRPAHDPETFARKWLRLLDSLAPVEEYLKFLPDGNFEQWSYPEIEIKNIEQLKQFFAATWGTIKSQSNQITRLTVSPLPDGRSQIEIDVNWSASTSSGHSFSRALNYSLTVGPGSSAGDPTGSELKIYRYRMTRP